jgi:hypothetical protein
MVGFLIGMADYSIVTAAVLAPSRCKSVPPLKHVVGNSITLADFYGLADCPRCRDFCYDTHFHCCFKASSNILRVLSYRVYTLEHGHIDWSSFSLNKPYRTWSSGDVRSFLRLWIKLMKCLVVASDLKSWVNSGREVLSWRSKRCSYGWFEIAPIMSPPFVHIACR